MPAPHRAVLPAGHAKLVTTVPGTKNPKNLALGFLEPASAWLILTLGFVQHHFFKMPEEALEMLLKAWVCAWREPRGRSCRAQPGSPSPFPCRIVTHQLSLGHSLPQSGQTCPPAPPPPAVWRKHRGTASENQETRVEPTPEHQGELVPLQGSSVWPGLSYKPFQLLLVVSRQGSQTGFVVPTPPSAQTDAQTAQPQEEAAELPFTAGTLRTRSSTVTALEGIWTSTRAGMPPG